MNVADMILTVVAVMAFLPFIILIVGGSAVMVKELIEELTTPKNSTNKQY